MNMSVIIKRKTGGAGAGSKMSIKVNGENVKKIAYQQEVELDIQNEPALVKVEQLGVKSNEINVENGDVVEIKTTKTTYITIFVLFVYLIVSSFEQMAVYITPVRTIFFILLISTLFITNGFELRIIDTKSKNERIK